ncbi:MAG: RNA methyltransferase [candidate division Zixibacteria bacterium]|nr:RNA methyltransferase [candidate division Zixibacteria bacterium]
MAEGIRLLEESLRHKFLPIKLYYTESLLSDRGQWLVNEYNKEKVPLCKISAKEILALSDASTSQGVLGLFNIPQLKPGIAFKKSRKILLLDNISDPGNVGTLFRSALAFGLDSVILTNNSVDPFNPKVVRSSVGAIFGLPIIRATVEELLRFKKYDGYKLIVADMKGIDLNSKKINIKNYSRVILALGSEAEGISEYILAKADIKIMINHSDKVDSLNVAVAGSIIMKELYK